MLSYPDRHKFEEIRSQWEAVQALPHGTHPNMVGRREKAVEQQRSEETTNASKFRRKLSHGLSLISLSQRRTTPVRPQLRVNDLTTATDVPNPRPHETTRLLSPMREPPCGFPAVHRVTPNNVSPPKSLDPDATPKQLPRSRTMSFIPRPSQSGSELSIVEYSTPTPRPSALMLEEDVSTTPANIPSTDPSTPARRKSSIRPYQLDLTSQQAKHVAAGDAFAGSKIQPPSKSSPIRSYTTPNLVKDTHSSGPSDFMTLRKPAQQKGSGIPVPQKTELKENSTPVTHRHTKRLSNIQEHSPSPLKQENLMAPTIASKRRSVGPSSALAQSKRGACTTPPVSSKHKSSHALSQTPLEAQRSLPKNRSSLHGINPPPASNNSATTQNRLLGPVSPLTSATRGHVSTQASLPRAKTEKDIRRRALSPPYKKMGGGMLPRAHSRVNNEVRLPRSSTHHRFMARDEDIPPVPPIPEKYKSTSMPLLVTPSAPKKLSPDVEEDLDVQEQDHEKFSLSSRDLSPVVVSKMRDHEFSDHQRAEFRESDSDNDSQGQELLSTKSKPEPNIQKRTGTLGRVFSASSLLSAVSGDFRFTKSSKTVDGADSDVILQVKDYMPLQYWAGRFQSRFDQWRTEAMRVELYPDHTVEGPLSHCNVHQDTVAICHIFLQLRDLCISHQAAESLWVSTPLCRFKSFLTTFLGI